MPANCNVFSQLGAIQKPALTLLDWVKVLFLPNAKNAVVSKIKSALVLKSLFSEITCVCVLMYQISSF